MKRALTLAAALPAFALASLAQARTDPDAALAADFGKRIADYMALRKTAENKIHRLRTTNSPVDITRHEHELAERLRDLRKDAVQGSIFTYDIAAMLRRVIAQSMQTSDAPAIQASLAHAEPIRLSELHVNRTYPETTPLQSMPASLLLNLPKLPQELEYRFSGRTLLLRDVGANLIVDYFNNAIP